MKQLGGFTAADWPNASDYKNSHFAQTASTAHAADLTTGSSAPQFVKIMSNTTAWLRWGSTGAAVPSANVLDGSAVVEQIQQNWQYQGQVPVGSTGYSIAFLTSGYASVSFYKK
jgi:hypothetical protein